ncbi:MAG: hypothetical protein J7482_20500, partial [Roseiflexus sp.]|nr:hypothetical protein [Roseiflexus sp.]
MIAAAPDCSDATPARRCSGAALFGRDAVRARRCSGAALFGHGAVRARRCSGATLFGRDAVRARRCWGAACRAPTGMRRDEASSERQLRQRRIAATPRQRD